MSQKDKLFFLKKRQIKKKREIKRETKEKFLKRNYSAKDRIFPNEMEILLR